MKLWAAIAALIVFGLASARAETPLSAWTELTGNGQSIRAVTTAPTCPNVEFDGKSQAMLPRAGTVEPFSNTICQAQIPTRAKRASIQGQALPLAAAAVRRIVIIGDTGCRLKGKFVQDCNDPAEWPFAAVALKAAEAHPDLVIHVGDYLYRETPCPEDDKGCAGSPHGDRWDTWNADFFTPAKPLLAAAPWIFIRGNHEQCKRSGFGWFRLLDAGATPLTCPATADPFSVRLGALTLMVMDSADTEDTKAPPDKVALFHSLFQKLDGQLSRGHGWLLTHRPIWGFMPKSGSGEEGEEDEFPVNLTEEAAARDVPLSGIDMVLSGHVHVFADVSFGPRRPAQLIVGDGGDIRDGTPGAMGSEKVKIDGLPATAFVASRFGYFVLDRVGQETDRWHGVLHGVDGGVIATCEIAPRHIACKKA